jgi:hypothetical protein
MVHVLCDELLGANGTITEDPVVIDPANGMPIGSLLLYAKATVAGGGGECDAYVQTLVGGDWIDVANFHFATASITGRYYIMSTRTLTTTIATPSFSRIADDTHIDGLIGDTLRVLLITSGNIYTGVSSVKVVAVVH